jgi:hypothetical protein
MRQCYRRPKGAGENGQGGRKGWKWRKSRLSGGQAKKNSSKLNERPRNVHENKGPLWKNAGLSGYVYENTGTYPHNPGMLLKTNDLAFGFGVRQLAAAFHRLCSADLQVGTFHGADLKVSATAPP